MQRYWAQPGVLHAGGRRQDLIIVVQCDQVNGVTPVFPCRDKGDQNALRPAVSQVRADGDQRRRFGGWSNTSHEVGQSSTAAVRRTRFCYTAVASLMEAPTTHPAPAVPTNTGKQSESDYSELIRWFFRDGVMRHRTQIARAIALEGIAIACQLGGLFVLFRYATSLENPGNALARFGVDPRGSMALVAVVGLLVTCLLSAYAWLSYRAMTVALEVRAAHEELCMRRGLVYCSRLPSAQFPQSTRLRTDGLLSTGAVREARAVARILDLLVRAVRQGGSVVIFLVALIYVSPLLSLGVLLISGFGVARLYAVNRAQARMSYAADATLQAAAKERKGLMKSASAEHPLEADSPALEAAFEAGYSRQYVDRFLELDRAKLRHTLWMELLAGLSIVLIVIASGVGIVSGSWSLTRLLSYIVLLRYFLSSLRKVGKFFADVSAMYATVERYHTLVVEVGAKVDGP
ncbi:MAG: ABC-type multidrug transport system fused ATPase/permease subunit [Myxococcota bacterium]